MGGMSIYPMTFFLNVICSLLKLASRDDREDAVWFIWYLVSNPREGFFLLSNKTSSLGFAFSNNGCLLPYILPCIHTYSALLLISPRRGIFFSYEHTCSLESNKVRKKHPCNPKYMVIVHYCVSSLPIAKKGTTPRSSQIRERVLLNFSQKAWVWVFW